MLLPGGGALIDLWLLVNLDPAALTLVLGRLVLGIAYRTKLFRLPPPETHDTPEPEPVTTAP